MSWPSSADSVAYEDRAAPPPALRRTDLVVTSIGRGEFVAPYAELITASEATDLVRLIVIPDRKTPGELFEAVDGARRLGVNVLMPTLEQQQDLLARLACPYLIPWDSDARRNVGFLLAWMSDAEYVVSIDDDNLPARADLINRHAVVAEPPATHTVVSCRSGWFNPCDMLTMDRPAIRIFARGFPYSQRTSACDSFTTRQAEAAVHVNAGLWWGDPDVDAVTRLAIRPAVRSEPPRALVLDRDTWAPVNTQNTAFHRDALPAYWFVRMGQCLLGHRIDRFGDIFSGYFVQACAKHLGKSIRFGDPVTNHVRNRHMLLEDLRAELPGILVLEHLSEWLRECALEGSSYTAVYLSLSHALDELAECDAEISSMPGVGQFLHQTASAMREWLELLSRVMA